MAHWGTGIWYRVKFLLQNGIFQFLYSISEGRCYCITCIILYEFSARDVFVSAYIHLLKDYLANGRQLVPL